MSAMDAVKYFGAVGGAIVTAWTLIAHVDTALVNQVTAQFATKQELADVKGKVDSMDGKLDLIIQTLKQK